MTDENIKQSKQAILDSATEVFAEKGFDGARVDEIARRAQVNKALIYYYFESKDKILEELMAGLIKKMVDLKDGFGMNQEDLNIKQYMDSGRSDEALRQLFDFMREHQSLLNIIMSEALKESSNKDILFEMLGIAIEDGKRRLDIWKAKIVDFEDFRLSVVFFAFLPMMNFISFGEKLAKHNHVDYKVLEEKYLQMFKRLYYDYLLKETFIRDE